MKEKDSIIMGEQICLRPIEVADMETLRCWRNQADVCKWFVYKQEISPEQQQNWWKKYQLDDNDKMFVIQVLSDNSSIGAVALYNIAVGEKAEFGRLMIGDRRFTGRGFAVEAVKEIVNHGFEVLNLKSIYLEVYEKNFAAIHIYEKAGFVKCHKNKEGLLAMQIIKTRKETLEF